MKKLITRRVWIDLVLLFLLLQGCGGRKEVLISGETMGTTYHIKLVTSVFRGLSGLEQSILEKLEAINRSMSTYEKNSEISRFNAANDVDRSIPISDDFYRVLLTAKGIYSITAGAWDGTVEPIVDLWGFGPAGSRTTAPKVPALPEIRKRLSTIGFDKLDIYSDKTLRKKSAFLSLDLNSIAKGYAVDQLAELLKENDFDDFLVEIGGETVARGVKKDGRPWRVGINVPRSDAAADSVYRVVILHNNALATSGDYRSFFEIDGVRYSHVFDPRTGYPVSNGVVSASVIARTCAFADGLATALMVMGTTRGLALVNRLDGVECLMVVEGPGGQLKEHYSKGFQLVDG